MTLVLSFAYSLQGQTAKIPLIQSNLPLKLTLGVMLVIHRDQLFCAQFRVLYLVAIICYRFEKSEDLLFTLKSFGAKILVQIQGQLTHSLHPLQHCRIYSLHFPKPDGIVLLF